MLESLGARTMYRLAYRNFGGPRVPHHEPDHRTGRQRRPDLADGYRVVRDQVTRHHADAVPGRPGGQPGPNRVPLDGVHGHGLPGQHRDGLQHLQHHPVPQHQLHRPAGRGSTGTMPYEQGTIQTGSGSQTGSAARWGDYTTPASTRWTTAPSGTPTSTCRPRASAAGAPGSPASSSRAATPPQGGQRPRTSRRRAASARSRQLDRPGEQRGLPITGYTVVANPGGATCTTVVGADLNPLTCTVPGLTDGQSYEFSVVAHNGQGDSPAGTAPALATPAPRW